MDESKRQKVVEALAEYCGCPVEDIGGYVIGVEHLDEGRLIFSVFWNAGTPWGLKGMTTHLLDQVKTETARQQMLRLVGEAPPEEIRG